MLLLSNIRSLLKHLIPLVNHVLQLDHKQILYLDPLLDSVIVQLGLNEQNDLREGQVNVLPHFVLLLNEVAIPAGLVLLI